MNIKPLNEKDSRAYNRLARSCGSIFDTLEWTDIFGSRVQRYGFYNQDGKLIGGFITYSEKQMGLSVYRNPPFTPTIGPFIEIKAQNHVAVMNTWKKALGLMADFADKQFFPIISFVLNRGISDTQPFVWRKFKVIPHYTYIINLRDSTDDIQKRMSPERRNDIRKAFKDGFKVRQLDNFKIVESLVRATFRRQNKPLKIELLNKILFEFAPKGRSFSFATFKDENPVAGAFCVYDKDTAYYILGGYDAEKKHHGAGAIALWEAIKHSKELGLKYFDFEGSMVPAIEKYFRGFGGYLTPKFRINKAWLPLEMFLKVFKRELF